MATAQSTGKTRSTRNRPARRRPKAQPEVPRNERPAANKIATHRPSEGRPDQDRDDSLEDLIETERGRLQQAEAVLECLQFALTYDDWFEPNEAPSYSDVADVARGIIRMAVNNLDSLYVGRQIAASDADR